MTGYGAEVPDANWPNGAKIAVQIVLNYEEGSENNILHGDAASEAFLSEITGATPWHGQRHWNMESIYEYGSRAGFWRLHSLLKDLPITVYGVATALARAPQQLAAMKQAGWEIASHGFKWIEHKDMSVDEERLQIRDAIHLHTEVVGAPPRGWYTGRCSMNTVNLAAEEGDFAYIADSYADDLPYWMVAGGKDQLIVPYTMDCNDMRFAIQAGFTNGDQFESYLKDSFDMLYAEGQAGAPKMLSIGLHCRIAGRPGRAMAIKRALAHFMAHDGVWFATRAQIADHWTQEHPPSPRLKPSEMDRETFVAEFGGIFKDSPWIAEGAFALELGPTHDNAQGVHNALARIFRRAPRNARAEVLRAQPDLAKELSDSDIAGVSGTECDLLSERDRDALTDLNAAYIKKFGFPFIIALGGITKESIMEALHRRVENDPETEFTEACHQVERIAELHLIEKFRA